MSKAIGPSPLHPLINPADLQENGNLISTSTLNAIAQTVHVGPTKIDRKLHAELFPAPEVPRSLLFSRQGVFALYRDRSHDTDLAKHGYLGAPRARLNAVSKVKLVQHQNDRDGKWYAVKILTLSENIDIVTYPEIVVLKHLGLLKDAFIISNLHEQQKLYIIMDLAPGKTLDSYLQELLAPPVLKPQAALQAIIKMTILGLISVDKLHSKGVIHKDLFHGGYYEHDPSKLRFDNWVINPEQSNIHIIDFGQSFLSVKQDEFVFESNRILKAFLNFIAQPQPRCPDGTPIRTLLWQKEYAWFLDLVLLLNMKLKQQQFPSLKPVIALLTDHYQRNYREQIPGAWVENPVPISEAETQEIAAFKQRVTQYMHLSMEEFCEFLQKEKKGQLSSPDTIHTEGMRLFYLDLPYNPTCEQLLARKEEFIKQIKGYQCSFTYPQLFSKNHADAILAWNESIKMSNQWLKKQQYEEKANPALSPKRRL